MKGKDGTVYHFEVKSLEEAQSAQRVIDGRAYEKKIEALKKWYKAASKRIERYVFCVPVLSEGEWKVYAYKGGEPLEAEAEHLSWREFRGFVKKQNRGE